MNEYRAAWLELIYWRDMLYTLTLLCAAVAVYWYRFSRGKLYRLLVTGGALAVLAGLLWGVTILWG